MGNTQRICVQYILYEWSVLLWYMERLWLWLWFTFVPCVCIFIVSILCHLLSVYSYAPILNSSCPQMCGYSNEIVYENSTKPNQMVYLLWIIAIHEQRTKMLTEGLATCKCQMDLLLNHKRFSFYFVLCPSLSLLCKNKGVCNALCVTK